MRKFALKQIIYAFLQLVTSNPILPILPNLQIVFLKRMPPANFYLVQTIFPQENPTRAENCASKQRQPSITTY